MFDLGDHVWYRLARSSRERYWEIGIFDVNVNNEYGIWAMRQFSYMNVRVVYRDDSKLWMRIADNSPILPATEAEVFDAAALALLGEPYRKTETELADRWLAHVEERAKAVIDDCSPKQLQLRHQITQRLTHLGNIGYENRRLCSVLSARIA